MQNPVTFIDGNPATSTLGTQLTAAFFNGIQNSVANAITGMGGTLDPTNNNDLLNVLLGIVAGDRYKGEKNTAADLPGAGNTTGDVWMVISDADPTNNVPWIWTGAVWQKEAYIPSLSGYQPLITTMNAALGADVALTNSNQYYDILSLALTQGVWEISGFVSIYDNTNQNANLTLKLWDGAAAVAATPIGGLVKNANAQILCTTIPFSGEVTVGVGGATWKISAASDSVGAIAKAAAPYNAAGNFATVMRAWKKA